MALDLFDPSYAQTVLVLGLLLGAWRLVAMVDAWLFARRAGSRGALASAVLAVLAVLVVGAHGYVGYVSWAFYDAGSNIFVGSAGGDLPFPTSSPHRRGRPARRRRPPSIEAPAARPGGHGLGPDLGPADGHRLVQDADPLADRHAPAS